MIHFVRNMTKYNIYVILGLLSDMVRVCSIFANLDIVTFVTNKEGPSSSEKEV